MKYSYNWMQEHIEGKLPKPEALKEHIVFYAFEVEGVAPAGEDTIFDIKVLPDRAGDCLSHAGMAREIAGLLGLQYREASATPLPEAGGPLPVDIKDERCRAYIAVRIDGVRVSASPAWLAEKLESIGQRAVNNIVDATNYVLFDTGQPIHAFDAANVDGGIVVRAAHDGETIKLLGGEEQALTGSDLVIADYLGAIAIAGVKGGAAAEVSEATTSVIVEVANFDAASVRKTSRRLGLITDASKRFENGYSPASAPAAAARVVTLITELAGGTVSAVSVSGSTEVPARTVPFATADITRILGSSVSGDDIERVLSQYQYRYEREGDSFTLAVPHYRADITGPHDIAEEVGRVIGYDRIPASPLPFSPAVQQNETDLQVAAVRAWAVASGYREVYTYAFRPKGDVAVAYGAAGKDKLRANLSDGLKESYELNRRNAPLLGTDGGKLFEIGTVFIQGSEAIHVAVCDGGAIQELPLVAFINERGIDASAGLTAAIADPQPFTPWSAYPFVTRDLAVWVSDEGARERLEAMVAAFAAAHCVRKPQLFDTFTKDGRTSLAYRFVFQSPERTLTDEEVSRQFGELAAQIAADPAFEIR